MFEQAKCVIKLLMKIYASSTSYDGNFSFYERQSSYNTVSQLPTYNDSTDFLSLIHEEKVLFVNIDMN